MDHSELFDFLKKAEHPLSIGQIHTNELFSHFSRREVAVALQALSAKGLACRSLRQGKAYYCAVPGEVVCEEEHNETALECTSGIVVNAVEPEKCIVSEMEGSVEPAEPETDELEQKCRNIQQQRDEAFTRVCQRLDEAYEQKTMQAKRSTAALYQKLRNSIVSLEREQLELSAELAELGVLEVGQKKRINRRMEEVTAELAEHKAHLIRIRPTLEGLLEKMKAKLEQAKENARVEIDKNYPMPSAQTMEEKTPVQLLLEKMQQQILDYLHNGQLFSVEQISDGIASACDTNHQRTAALLRRLMDQGKVVCEQIEEKEYFRLA